MSVYDVTDLEKSTLPIPSQLSYSVLQSNEDKKKAKWFAIWKEYASYTTLHGPNHITSTTKHWRTYYIAIFIIMICLFIAHSGFLIYQYKQFPINTDVKFQNILYSYPDVTICPNSGTSEYLLNKSKEALDSYNSSRAFWEGKKIYRESTEKLIKRNYLKYFYRYSRLIGRLPYQHIIWCQINDQSCLDQIFVTEHPTYYRCFTLRPKTQSILAGPTHGITILLHRGDPSKPLLQVNENLSYEEQASIKEDKVKNFTGFIIGFHERGSFPNFQLLALPAVTNVRFGDQVRISLDLTSLRAANLKIRPCDMTKDVPLIQLIKSDPISSSFDDSNQEMLKFSYIRQSCIAMKRQELIYKTCECFSEEYNIPYHMKHFGNVWCYDVKGKTDKIVNIDSTIGCVEKINQMTENEVLFNYIKMKSDKNLLKTFSVCPLRCDRFIHLIQSVFKDSITHSIALTNFQNYFEHLALKGLANPFLKMSSVVDSSDLIALDISTISEYINEVVETQAFDKLNLISQIGGISGLYIGITIFTIFEILDLMFQWLYHLFLGVTKWLPWKRFVNPFKKD